MPSPTVSVIIPAYNNAQFIGAAIQSVLDQTYPHFEVMVVNDASPDPVDEVMKQFTDPRIRYIIHDKNRGLSAARNTGIRASTGEMIALLDGDDIFHPEKLRMHVEFLEQHPEIGVTYNARFELNHSANTIRELWRPPIIVDLAELMLGFPFSPSDMVLRRDWAFQVNLFDIRHTYVGEDLDINCRLALAGCKFASVDRALNYRRYHSGKVFKDLISSIDDTLRPLNAVFTDPRCPSHVLALRDVILSTHYMLWAIIAFAQHDTTLGREFCTTSVKLNPTLLAGEPCRLLESLLSYSILDESQDHEQLLRSMLDQLPTEMKGLTAQYDWAVAQGYLHRSLRSMIWGHAEDGREHLTRAAALGAQIDERFLRGLIAQLLNFEIEFGVVATDEKLHELTTSIAQIGRRQNVRWLKGCYLINRAFRSYHAREYGKVSMNVIHAVTHDPNYLRNRGVMAILFRSTLYSGIQRAGLKIPTW